MDDRALLLGRSGEIGVAVEVEGSAIAATLEVRRATTTWWNRVDLWLRDGVVVPLLPRRRISLLADAERATLDALCTFLGERPLVRPRLSDHGRVGRLVLAMSTRLQRPMPERTGAGRASFEVHGAMHRLGYRHPRAGRPYPGDTLPDEATVVDRIVRRVAANPFAAGVDVSPELVTEIVRKDYLGVRPWPFEALVD